MKKIEEPSNDGCWTIVVLFAIGLLLWILYLVFFTDYSATVVFILIFLYLLGSVIAALF